MKEFYNQNKVYKKIPKYLSIKLFVHEYFPCLSPYVNTREEGANGDSIGLQEFIEEMDNIIEN